MAEKRLKTGRLFGTMVVIAATIFMVDAVRRGIIASNDDDSITVKGHFKGQNELVEETDDSLNLGNESQATTADEGLANVGFTEFSIPSVQMASGMLVVIDEKHTGAPVSDESMIDLIDVKNAYYILANESVRLEADAAEALNIMMEDYYDATGLADFIVYGTTETYTGEGSYCPQEFPESMTGNTVDLALNGMYSVLSYDGYDEESWIVENCCKYGFVVRCPEGKSDMTGSEFCPWHLRYVGKLHAAVMNERGYCLEEYLNFLRGFTFDYPFSYTYDGVAYEIYSVESMGDVTPARVPVSGNYTISGTNMGHYIITTVKS